MNNPNPTTMSECKKDSPHIRVVHAYLPPRYHRYFVAYTAYVELSKSTTATKMIMQFFDNMPEKEKESMLQYYRMEQQEKAGR